MVDSNGNEWKGFWPKLLQGALGTLVVLLVGYFVWLGTAMTEVRADVAIIKTEVKSLNQTRQRTLDYRAESNRQRLDALEEEGEGTE